MCGPCRLDLPLANLTPPLSCFGGVGWGSVRARNEPLVSASHAVRSSTALCAARRHQPRGGRKPQPVPAPWWSRRSGNAPCCSRPSHRCIEYHEACRSAVHTIIVEKVVFRARQRWFLLFANANEPTCVKNNKRDRSHCAVICSWPEFGGPKWSHWPCSVKANCWISFPRIVGYG